ncbi:efflux RND transporter periplasmic adaptor subunit [Chitinibacteraceae bacterium HSL-7]
MKDSKLLQKSRGIFMRLALIWAVSSVAHAAPAYDTKPLSAIATYPQTRAVLEVVSLNRSKLSAEVAASVAAIPVQVGQRVSKGAVVARLDDRQYRLQLDQAKAQVAQQKSQLALAELRLNQARALQSSQFVSADLLKQRQTEFAVARDGLAIADQGVRLAQLALDKTLIRAPFDATVTERLVGVGELAAPGTPLVALTELGNNELRARVPASQVAGLTASSEVSVRAGGVTQRASIVRVADVIDTRDQTRTVVFKTEQSLPAGVAGELSWKSAQPYLPAGYVQPAGKQMGAWVEEGGKPVFKPIAGAQPGRAVLVSWPLSTRIVDQGRFALGAPAQR